ncbi:hypothetical protein PACTADRAFT_42376 [Pachysolen tannophilus NRRL Y-2460]|uniref:Adenosylmethionine decarboxylase n=1 Tax=Pachysolen tannophilus NRRL Y-2460 TaxID=669874 RepID=A0A1E4TUH3_PACTA|nr:hypothetical protein PACTADRAFT_42376 [Pachysolen tannophilus NRRL Y-2460]
MAPSSAPLISPEPSIIRGDFINHEISASLDSTAAFEGPEKLLEIWFADSPSNISTNNVNVNGNALLGLRSIPLHEIEALLDLVNCKILSKISSNEMDGYLLSESSLFVFPHKLILKTCGTTTTLSCLQRLFELAEKYINWNPSSSVYRIFYSRRSFMFPDRQKEVHQSWANEVNYLNKYFDKSSSKAYVVGDLSNDHWYLYINGVDNGANEDNNGNGSDETFELLMTDLSPYETPKFISSNFTNDFPDMDEEYQDFGHLLGLKTMAKTGLNSIFQKRDVIGGEAGSDYYEHQADEDDKHDAFSFQPCGFSSNSIIDGKFYYTLHVTPEQGWSYASFETNVPSKISKVEIMNKVLKIFKPGKFCLVYMSECGPSANEEELLKLIHCNVKGYKKVDKIIYDLKFNYKCLYSYFEKV